MSQGARRTNVRLASALGLAIVLAHCSRNEGDAKRSLGSASAARGAPQASSSASAPLAPPSSSAPSPPFTMNRAPTGEGDDFFIEVPKLTVDSPPELGSSSSELRACPPELKSADTPREKLERMAESDPCAKSALVSKLLAGRPSHDDFRRALRLAIEAQVGGAEVQECFLFDFAGDGARLATCAERTGDTLLSSLLHVSGYGVPRDLGLAAALLEKGESRACGYEQVKAIIESERAHPTDRRYVFCRDAACTSLEWQQCYRERNYRYDWQSSALRAKLALAASPHARPFEELLALFDELVRHDSMQVYWGDDGLLSQARALSQELVLKQRFDALLEDVLVEKKLPDADDAEIAALQRRVHELDRVFLKRKPRSASRAGERYVVAYVSAQKAYQKLEQRFVPFATSVLDRERDRAARAALLRFRAETLGAASQP